MTEEQFILSIDQGTTSSRALLVNQKGEIVASSQQEFEQIFRRSGWVEHDAVEIWRSVQSVIAELMIEAEITHKNIAAIGIANQRETTVIWDRKTEQPVAPAIVWQSRQSQDIAEELVRSGYQDLIQEKTGLLIDAYYSATKIRWLLDHIEDGQKRAEQGDLMFGTIDAWILYKLTGGQVHATDYSNASRTMLFNIHDLTWDQDILEILNIPKELLPDVKSNSEVYGYTASRRFFGGQVPIAGMAGDQQASMIGQQCFEAGMTKNTYGTGSFIMMNLGSTAFISNHKLATTIAYVIDEEVNYALEGSVFVTGSAVQWLRDGLQLFKSADETEAMAMASSNSDDLYIVPAFTGLGAPYWKSDARGAIFGLNRSTNQKGFAQAVLRSIAYQSQDVLTTMCKDTGMSVQELHVDGGAAENDYLLQFQADISNTDLVRAENVETTALGVAFLAGLAVGFWQDLDEIQSLIQLGQAFYPNMDSEQREKLLAGWAKAVSATIFYAEEE